jgi:hypothetical protein
MTSDTTAYIAPRFLGASQIEAHVARLNAIKAGLCGYPDDGRAVDSIPVIETMVGILLSERYAPETGIAEADEE